MKKLALLLASLAVALLAGGCGSKGSSADAPAGLQGGRRRRLGHRDLDGGTRRRILDLLRPRGRDHHDELDDLRGHGDPQGLLPARGHGARQRQHLLLHDQRPQERRSRRAGRAHAGRRADARRRQLGRGRPAGHRRRSTAIAVGHRIDRAPRTWPWAPAARIFTSINGAATTTPTNPAAPADLNARVVQHPGLRGGRGQRHHALQPRRDRRGPRRRAEPPPPSTDSRASRTGGFVVVGAAGTIVNSGSGTSWVAGARR